MRIEIDQSGKIENTRIATVVAYSNSKNKSIKISGKTKREIQTLFRKAGKPKVFLYKTFAILIFLLIKDDLNKISQIIIDVEYSGWSHQIKDYLLRELRKHKKFNKDDITFYRIGKKSNAHDVAYLTAINQRKADKIIALKDIIQYLI